MDYLVDPTEGRHIHSLPPDGTGTTDTGRVLTGSTVDDGIHQDLEGVLGNKSGGITLSDNMIIISFVRSARFQIRRQKKCNECIISNAQGFSN